MSFFGDVLATFRPAQDARHGPLVPLMVALTLLTGVVDAVSYLTLGHVFVANMTGNVVFLGFALAGAGGLSVASSLLALAMGVQNAAAQKLAVPELTTTVLTKTLVGIAAEGSLVGGRGANVGRRTVSVIAMLLGALAGGALALHVSIAAALAVALAVSLLVAVTAHVVSRSNAAWTTRA